MSSQVADNIYFNASLKAGDNNELASFTIHRDTQILQNPNDYYLRVESLEISSTNIPTFTLPSNSFSVTIGVSQVFLSNVISDPAFPNNVYYDSQIIQSINNAFVTANINAATGLPPPVMIFNYDINYFQLVIPSAYVLPIYFNDRLFRKFIDFNSVLTNLPLGRYRQIIYFNNGINLFPTGISASIAYSVLVQTYENSGNSNLIDIRSIRLISNLIPVNPEYITNILHASTNDFSPIIAEYQLRSFGNNIENILKFTSLNDKGYIDINSTVPLSTIDIQAYYITFSGERHLIELAPFDVFDVKLNFVKKSIINVDKSKLLLAIDNNTR